MPNFFDDVLKTFGADTPANREALREYDTPATREYARRAAQGLEDAKFDEFIRNKNAIKSLDPIQRQLYESGNTQINIPNESSMNTPQFRNLVETLGQTVGGAGIGTMTPPEASLLQNALPGGQSNVGFNTPLVPNMLGTTTPSEYQTLLNAMPQLVGFGGGRRGLLR